MKSFKEEPNITSLWIIEQIEMLLKKCPFKSKSEPFLLNPNCFYDILSYKDKAIFLMKRYNLPFKEISIYLHAGLKQPGKVELQKVFDTEKITLQSGQKIMAFNDDGTFSILDLHDPHGPKLIEVNDPLPLKSIKLSMFLNQDFVVSKEVMGSIIAHETAHLYLYFNGLQKFSSSSELKDPMVEYITDITAFTIGLGILMLNGCGVKRRTIHQANQIITEETRLGYLSLEQMKFAHDQVLARI